MADVARAGAKDCQVSPPTRVLLLLLVAAGIGGLLGCAVGWFGHALDAERRRLG